MKRILSFLLFILVCTVSNATHNRAGQILFRHISGYTYEFTLTTFTYTDSQADRPEMDFYWGDNTSTRVDRIPKPRDLCEKLPGFYQKNVYIAQHTFPGAGVYAIYIEDQNRNLGVENIPNSVSVVFGLKTVLSINPNTGHNNAPELLTYPIDKAAVGQKFVHNPSAYDADGDSLSYELAVCLREGGIEIEDYKIPNASNTPIYVDPITGDFVWDTPETVGFYNFAMKINEWRRGIKINSITRDMQIEVVDSKNRPPDLPEFKDTCVIAGSLISIPIRVTDPDNDNIILTATGGPFHIDTAKLTIDNSGPGYLDAVFTWQTDYSHVRKQYYTVTFKAEDQNSEVKLVSFANYNITVIAPPVENLTVIADKKETELIWNQTVCTRAAGYEIYRSIGSNNIVLGVCETGIPSGSGYEKVTTLTGISDTTYRDNNNGKGLSPGIEYCYRVVAFFSDGAQSLPSDEACTSLLAGTPPMIQAHVETVDLSGEIHVAWIEKPVLDIIAGKTGPFEYRLYYTLDMDSKNWSLLSTKNIGDTTYIHGPIDTKTSYPYYYKVELWETNGALVEEDFEIASSLYPILEPSDKSVMITFGRYTPWVNTEYDIYRCTKTGTDICIASELAGRTDREAYTDTGLRNGQEYCYRIHSKGYRNIGGIIYENENWSHVACVTPQDNVPPCVPELKGESICDEDRNRLDWSYDPTCMGDVEKYRIYFTPNPGNQGFALTDSVMNRDIHTYSHSKTLVGCYYVTAVDSAGNQSQGSNIVCLDQCGEFDLPNVFTPNGDNINDVFVSQNPGGVTKVDMKIFNRWGKLVFKTDDPDINWDGRDIDSKRFVPSGVYFYTCDVYEDRLTGQRIIPLSGFVHVFYGKDAQPFTPTPMYD